VHDALGVRLGEPDAHLRCVGEALHVRDFRKPVRRRQRLFIVE
jgi:hypothetical protein